MKSGSIGFNGKNRAFAKRTDEEQKTFKEKMMEGEGAELDAFSVAGVVSVENALAVRPSTQPPSDPEILTRIKTLLLWDPDIEPTRIDIPVIAGEVFLEGSVKSYREKREACELASRVEGVKNITDKLTVVPTEKLSDRVIAENITGALERHAEVDEALIDIQVQNGNVTLSGTVPTRTLYRIALDIAQHTHGVINIRDKIVVQS